MERYDGVGRSARWLKVRAQPTLGIVLTGKVDGESSRAVGIIPADG